MYHQSDEHDASTPPHALVDFVVTSPMSLAACQFDACRFDCSTYCEEGWVGSDDEEEEIVTVDEEENW